MFYAISLLNFSASTLTSGCAALESRKLKKCCQSLSNPVTINSVLQSLGRILLASSGFNSWSVTRNM